MSSENVLILLGYRFLSKYNSHKMLELNLRTCTWCDPPYIFQYYTICYQSSKYIKVWILQQTKYIILIDVLNKLNETMKWYILAYQSIVPASAWFQGSTFTVKAPLKDVTIIVDDSLSSRIRYNKNLKWMVSLFLIYYQIICSFTPAHS